jgi:hypothetical protein
MKVTDLDIVYISYDEPKAGEFFDHLQKISPRKPLRVHGVKGFDTAHKAAANLATTERFITVDGDNLVRPNFFNTNLEMKSDYVYSFTALNVVNGLAYGNGGIKIWPRNLVLNVGTHEGGQGNDFCWTYRYWQINDIASDVHFNQSPFHAFRGGYREGVKLSLVKDQKLADWKTACEKMYPPNLSRLKVWASIGTDVQFGDWAILGARWGIADLWVHGIDLDLIRDYDWFTSKWNAIGVPSKQDMGYWLHGQLGTPFPNIIPSDSAWFKSVYVNQERHGPMIPNMEPVNYDRQKKK